MNWVGGALARVQRNVGDATARRQKEYFEVQGERLRRQREQHEQLERTTGCSARQKAREFQEAIQSAEGPSQDLIDLQFSHKLSSYVFQGSKSSTEVRSSSHEHVIQQPSRKLRRYHRKPFHRQQQGLSTPAVSPLRQQDALSAGAPASGRVSHKSFQPGVPKNLSTPKSLPIPPWEKPQAMGPNPPYMQHGDIPRPVQRASHLPHTAVPKDRIQFPSSMTFVRTQAEEDYKEFFGSKEADGNVNFPTPIKHVKMSSEEESSDETADNEMEEITLAKLKECADAYSELMTLQETDNEDDEAYVNGAGSGNHEGSSNRECNHEEAKENEDGKATGKEAAAGEEEEEKDTLGELSASDAMIVMSDEERWQKDTMDTIIMT